MSGGGAPERWFCSGHQRWLPADAFQPSSFASHVHLCRPCVNERRRARYKADPAAALLAESRARTGVRGITRHLYETVLSLHHHRCFISGAAGQSLVLLRVDQFPLSHEPAHDRFVPVLRKYAGGGWLEGDARRRFDAWADARTVKRLQASAAPAPSGSSATPSAGGLVRKGLLRAQAREDVERFIIRKAVQHGIDAVGIYHGMLLAKHTQ